MFTAVESLLKHCRDLTVLDASGCSGITNTSLELFALYCTSEDRPSLTCILGGRNCAINLLGGTFKFRVLLSA